MSFEGHYQALCKNGHMAGFPVLYGADAENKMFEEFRCPALVNNVRCGAEVGETNLVDDTNCESYGHKEYIEISPQETKTCDLGHVHVWTAARYRFSDEQYYYDGEKLVPLERS